MAEHLFPACRPMGVSSSDRPAWLAARRQILTASDLAAILGKDPYRSALDVWVDKVQPPEDEDVTIEDPRFWGLGLEQTIAQLAAGFYHWEYRGAGELLQSIEFPFLGCTLDGVLRIPGRSDWGVYEGKTTSVFLLKDWDAEAALAPLRVLIQAQQQLMVTRAPYNQLFCLVGGFTPRAVLVEPHAVFQEKIAEAADHFMGLVRAGTPPEPAHNSQAALDRLFPEEMLGKVVDLPYQVCEWSERLDQIAIEKKALQFEEDLLKNRIRATMGDAQFGLMPREVNGKRVWKWATQGRAAYSVEATSFRQLLKMNGLPAALHAVPRRLVPAVEPLEAQLEAAVTATASAPVIDISPIDDAGEAPPIRLKGRRRR